MKMNDPFGRLAARHQRGYESMRASLQQAGIVTVAAADAVVEQAWRRGVMILLTALLILLPLSLGLGLFLLVWVVSSTLNGRRYIKRYIEEELKQ